MKIFFRDHVKETLRQLIRTCEICNEPELISLAEQLLRKMEEYENMMKGINNLTLCIPPY